MSNGHVLKVPEFEKYMTTLIGSGQGREERKVAPLFCILNLTLSSSFCVFTLL